MRPYVEDEWMGRRFIEATAAYLPKDASVDYKFFDEGGMRYHATWRHNGGRWELESPYLCLWTEVRGPNGFRWTTRGSLGYGIWRCLKVLEAMGGIPGQRPSQDLAAGK